MVMDTAAAPTEDTGLELPEAPPVPDVEELTETVDDSSPETPVDDTTETETLFPDDVNLDEVLTTDPKVAKWLEDKLKGERAKADESNRQKREHEVAKAKREAETEALQQRYQQELTQAEKTYGEWGVNALQTIVNHIEENGSRGVDLKAALGNIAGQMLEANRVASVQSLTQARSQLFGELYPEAKLSEPTVEEWTRATYAKDIPAQNRAFAKAVAEAERARVMAELEAKSKSEAEESAKTEEEASKLQETDAVRRSRPRPTVNLPVGRKKQWTPAELDAIPMAEWERKPKAERDEMIASVEEWRRKNSNR